jgi:Bacterial Ig-like domain (group 3)
VSSATLASGQTVTYTATVTPGHAGPTEPLGTVDFLDDTVPIASCTVQPLTAGATSSTAVCTTKYVQTGTHIITAHYRPTRNFAASTSAPQTVTVKAPGTQPLVATTMRWTFLHTPTYTQILALVVNRAPTGGHLVISCTGRGCPYKKRVINVAKAKACKPKKGHPCKTQLARTFDLTAPFKKHRLAPGTRLVIEVLKTGYTGK